MIYRSCGIAKSSLVFKRTSLRGPNQPVLTPKQGLLIDLRYAPPIRLPTKREDAASPRLEFNLIFAAAIARHMRRALCNQTFSSKSAPLSPMG